MFFVFGAFLSVLIPYLFYKKILGEKLKENIKLYIKTFLLSATLYTLPIIIIEIVWDILFKDRITQPILFSIVQAFLRAALIEEAVKYTFSKKAIKKNSGLSKKEAILLAGVVGIGYGFTEKLVYGDGMALVINGLFPGHMLFQWIMGYYLYLAMVEKKKGNYFKAFIIPFVIHGLWDAGLDMTGFIGNLGDLWIIGEFVGMIAMMVVMFVSVVKMSKRIQNIEQ